MASAGPYASLHLAPDITTPVPHHSSGWVKLTEKELTVK